MQQTEEHRDTEQQLPSSEWQVADNDHEVSILDLLLVFGKHGRTILKITAAAAVLSLITALLLPKYYRGESVILTPKPAKSLSDIVSGLGLLSGISAGDSLGLTDPNDVYVAMLKSRGIATNIIDRFHLRDYYDKNTMVETLDKLADDTDITSGHDGTIDIRYEHKDPKIAAAVANAYVEELQKLTQNTTITAAQQRRDYFGKQFEQAKNRLADAEVALRKSQEASGVLDLDKQAAFIVGNIADLRGRITAQEVLIRGLRSFGTDRNPDVVREEQELAAMKAQLAELEKKNAGGDGDVFLATRNLPAKGLEFIRNLREVKYYEALYEVLGKQFEAANLDAASFGATIQVVDTAVPPDKKSKPKRALIVIGVTLAALLLSYIGAYFVETYRRMSRDPISGPKLSEVSDRLAVVFAPLRRVFRRRKSIRIEASGD